MGILHVVAPSYSNNDDKPLGLEENRLSLKPNLWPSRSADANSCSQYKCCECGLGVPGNGSNKAPDDDVVRERAAFENIIHNIVFVNNR